MNESCPVCHHHLVIQEHSFHCAHCRREFASQPVCPDCDQSLQVLKACGAVDYFCPNGDGLISRKRVIFKPLIESL